MASAPFPTLAEVKAKYQAALEEDRLRCLEQQRKEEEANSPEAIAKQKAYWEELMREREEREAARKAAYPANFAKALVDYTEYARGVIRDAIEYWNSILLIYEHKNPRTEFYIPLHEFGADYDDGGCCGRSSMSEGRILMWKSADDPSIDAHLLLDKEHWPEGAASPHCPTPLETLEEELEELGYTLEYNTMYGGEWHIHLTIPL